MRVGLVVPEYRTAESGGGGGVASVADFLLQALDPTWELVLVSPRTSRRAPESRRLLAPISWFRPIRARRYGDVTYVGAHLAESEVVRVLPRRAVDSLLAQVDVVLAVAGSPALAGLVRRVDAPVMLQVATFVDVERAQAISRATGVRKVALRASTWAVSRMDRRNLRVPDMVVVENEWMLNTCRELGARRVELCPPGVDTEFFTPGITAAPDGYIVSVSRLGDPRKDIGTLMRAYAYARRIGVTRKLVVAGRGELPPEVADLIPALGLSDHVEVRRDLTMDQLVTTLQAASFFAMSSTEEGLGLTMVEAMACGLPVVSTANEGARMVVGDSPAGELVPIGDATALGEAIARWSGLGTELEERASEARRRAVEHFSLAFTGRQFRQLISEVASIQGGAK